MDICIVRAKDSDAATLTAIAREAKAHWGYRAEQIERWHEQLSVDSSAIAEQPIFAARAGNELAGFYGLTHSPVGWELEHLWVRPSFMRRGIGSALMTHALDVARANGASELRIDADPFAEGFYLTCGAKRIGAIAAPLAGDLERIRPQLVIPLL